MTVRALLRGLLLTELALLLTELALLLAELPLLLAVRGLRLLLDRLLLGGLLRLSRRDLLRDLLGLRGPTAGLLAAGLLVRAGVLGPLGTVPPAQQLGCALGVRIPACRSVRMRCHPGTLPRWVGRFASVWRDL
ncbi:hypothetical protein GCM10010277_20020 [Streptomyces longisporoflavus]|nr:hypothetical protein GCM10010277_20020 [Streptomyces longisporoflavus]